MEVKAKKHLGQHFLNDLNIAQQIANSLQLKLGTVLEVGPGTGVLTQFLQKEGQEVFVSEVDRESIQYLIEKDIVKKDHLLGDFLTLDLQAHFSQPIAVIGNFPYNISSQILFKTLENRAMIPEFAGMFQKEVAERICSKPRSKAYGILSVLTQAFYHTEYLFTVHENVFTPPPKVKSGVIRLSRKEHYELECDEMLFREIVKTTFNTRRKMLRGSLKRIIGSHNLLQDPFFQKRPEELGFEEFVWLTQQVEQIRVTETEKAT
jgi:16S rRNA (adenine1518-N6/adenine1519-N6)-dimethyltransferase